MTDQSSSEPSSARCDEAEPLLVNGYNQMKGNPAAPQGQVQDALERIVTLYESWDSAEPGKGYAEKAAEWLEKLEETQKSPNAETPK